MPTKPPVACRRCGKSTTSGRYCEDHKGEATESKQSYDRWRGNDETTKLYHTARWFRFRDTFLTFNPICMRVINGQQCMKPTSIVHHLEALRVNLSRFLDPSNVAAVCKNHHRGGEEGMKPDERYVETRWYGQIVRREDPLTGTVTVQAVTNLDTWLNSFRTK